MMRLLTLLSLLILPLRYLCYIRINLHRYKLDNLHVKNNDDNTNKSLKLLLTSKKRKNALDDNKAANTLSSINKKKSKLLHDESFYKKLLLDSGIDIENEDEEEIEEEDLDDRIKLEEKLLANCEIVDLSSIIENDDGIEKIRDDGVIRINNVLSSNTCKQLLDVITNELKESIHAIESGEVDVFERFSSLLSNQNRFDLKLPMNNVIFNAIKELVNPNKDLGRTIKALVGKDSELFELASFYSKSKSSNQCIHSDTIHTKKSILFTITIALQDIDVDMGPTLFFPRTHKKLYHNKFYHEGSESRNKIVSERPKVFSTLSIGDCALYDSRVLHAGTANKSNKNRVLFYLSFINASGKNDEELDEDSFYNVASIRSEYIKKYTLSSFY